MLALRELHDAVPDNVSRVPDRDDARLGIRSLLHNAWLFPGRSIVSRAIVHDLGWRPSLRQLELRPYNMHGSVPVGRESGIISRSPTLLQVRDGGRVRPGFTEITGLPVV